MAAYQWPADARLNASVIFHLINGFTIGLIDLYSSVNNIHELSNESVQTQTKSFSSKRRTASKVISCSDFVLLMIKRAAEAQITAPNTNTVLYLASFVPSYPWLPELEL